MKVKRRIPFIYIYIYISIDNYKVVIKLIDKLIIKFLVSNYLIL